MEGDSEVGSLYSQAIGRKVVKVRWSPDKKGCGLVASGSWDSGKEEEEVRVWNADAEGPLRLLGQSAVQGDVTDLLFISPRRILSGTSRGHLYVLDFDGASLLRPVHCWTRLHTSGPNNASCSAISTFGDEIISGGSDGKLKLCNLRSSGTVQTLTGKEGGAPGTCSILSLAHVAQNQIVTGNIIGQIQVWDLRRSGENGPVVNLGGVIPSGPQSSALTSIASHPGQPHLLGVGTQSGTVGFCDLRRPSAPMGSSIAVHKGPVWELKFHPSYPDNLLSCSDDGNLFLWESNNFGPTPGGGGDSSMWLVGDALESKMNLVSLIPEQSLPVNSFDLRNDNVVVGTDNECIILRNSIFKS